MPAADHYAVLGLGFDAYSRLKAGDLTLPGSAQGDDLADLQRLEQLDGVRLVTGQAQ